MQTKPAAARTDSPLLVDIETLRSCGCIYTRSEIDTLANQALNRVIQEVPQLVAEQARLGALLHEVAELLGVSPVSGAIEEEALREAARRVQAQREESLRMLAAHESAETGGR